MNFEKILLWSVLSALGIIVITIALIFTYQNPSLLQAMATIVLVFVTSFYVYLIYKANENMRKQEKNRIEREEKRKLEEIKQLRNLIFTEININNNNIYALLAFIKKAKEVYKKKEVFLPVNFPYQDITYKTFLKEIGNLPTTETWNIMRIYTFLERIYFIFNTFLEDLEKVINKKKPLEDINYISRLDYLEKVTLDVKKYMDIQIEYYTDKDFPKFEKRFYESIKRKVRF